MNQLHILFIFCLETILMKQQQAINKYVQLIKKYQKRKKSNKPPSQQFRNGELFNLTSTLQSTFFKKSVQQKIKSKIKEIKQDNAPMQASVKLLQLEKGRDEGMRKTKRKFQVYQQEMERKRTMQREDSEEMGTIRQERNRIKESFNFQEKYSFLEEQRSITVPNQIKPLVLKTKQSPQKNTSKSSHGYKHAKSLNKSEPRNTGKKMCELDGSIFHFQNKDQKSKQLYPFYRNMFHNKDQANEKVTLYRLLKTMSPITIKSKLIKEGTQESRSFAFKVNQPKTSKHQKMPEIPEQSKPLDRQSLSKSKLLSSLHKRERSSLINLRQANQTISGWDITQEK